MNTLNNGGGIRDILSTLNDLSEHQKAVAIANTALSNAQKGQLMAQAGISAAVQNTTLGYTEMAAAQAGATATTGGLTSAFTGLWASMKPVLAALATNPLTWFAAAGVAAIALEDLFTVDYGEAHEALEESSTKYQETQTELESLKSKTEEYKDTLSTMAGNYNIDITGADTVEGIIDKIENSDTSLTLTDQSQLDKLKSENTELERQITLQEKRTELSKKSAINDAKEAMAKKDHSVAQSIKAGDSKGEKDFKGIVGKVTDTEAVKEDIDLINKYNDKIPELEEKITSAQKNIVKYKKLGEEGLFKKLTAELELKNAKEELEHYQDSVKTLYDDVDSRSESIQSELDILKLDPSANVESIRELEDALNSVNNIDLSPAEKSLKALDSYFSGSDKNNFIKSQLENAYKDGKNLETELSRLGLSLDTLGIDNVSQLESYFKKVASAASDAAKTVKDYSTTVGDIEESTSSANQDNDWSVIQSAYKSAKELIKEGKTGTDDVQSMAKFLNPKKVKEYAEQGGKYTADAYQRAIQDISATADRWFGENETKSMENFVNDFKNKGLWNVTTDDMGLWDIQKNFSTTAEAADKFGMSVNSVETMLHGLEAYGYDFSDVMFSGEGLNRYESALDKIKSLYDGMKEGSQKERLKGLIGNWDSELQGYQNDMSKLTEDQIVHIEFEYNLASIQQKIDEIKGLINGGDDTVSNHAQVIAGNQTYIDTASKGAGLDTEGVTIPVAYEANENSIEALQSQINKATSEKDKKKIQVEVENLQGLQQQLLNTFSDLHPEINADSSIEEINTAWDSFVSSAEGQEIVAKINADDAEAKKRVADILGVDPEDITVSVDADTSGAESKINGILRQINELQNGQTLVFAAEVDGVKSVIEAVKNEDGTITYTANINGVQSEVNVVKDQDGSVTYHKASQEEASDSNAGVDYTKTSQQEASNSSAGVNYVKTGQEAPSPMTASVRYVVSNTIDAVKKGINAATGSGGLTGTAHTLGTAGLFPIPKLSGRALAMGTLEDDSWLKPQWKTQKTETALTGETGVEMVVHGNRWWTVGDNGSEFASIPQGSVIFNAKQTKQLLEDGFTPSRAKGSVYLKGLGTGSNSYMSGTAYRLGSGTSSKSKSKSSSAGKAAATAANATQDALDAITGYFDWIKVRFDRLSRETDIAEKAIDSAIGLSNKQSATSTAISKVQAEMDAAQQGANRYLEHANWFASNSGLSQDLQSRVQSGTIDISKYDDDTKKKIEEYQSYYEDYLSALDKVQDLQAKEIELAQKRLKNIEDFYNLVVSVSESIQKANDAQLKYEESLGFSNVSDSVRKIYEDSMSEAEKVYKNSIQQLNDYQAEFNDLIAKGYIKEESDAWYDGQKKLNEFRQAVSESAITVEDFADKIRGISYTKIQNLIDGFERLSGKLDKWVSLQESRDEKIPESVYQEQMDTNNAQIVKNKELRDKKLDEQSYYAVDSPRYQELAEEIQKLDENTLDLMIDNEKLKNSIFELRFQPLDDALSKYSALRKEIDTFQSLLNKDAFFDKNGVITDEGLVNLALLQQGLSTAKKQIADYRIGLDKLQKSYDNDIISEDEFNKKNEEYRKGLQDAAVDVENYKDSLTELYMNQMKAENDILKEIINKRKDALKAKADYYDYDKKIRSQTKDLNSLKAQRDGLVGVNNAAAQAELKRLNQQIADAEEELNETRRSHANDMQEKGYDSTLDDLDEIVKNTEYEIAHNAEKQQSVIQSMLNNVVSMYESAYGKINSIINNIGWIGSNDFNKKQEELGTEIGAGNQMSDATQSQIEVKPSGDATGTVTDKINSNDKINSEIEHEIMQKPNTDNRPVVELIASPTSLSVEEGKSGKISTRIRPTDAKNQTLSWKSSNESVATVTDGNVKAIKPGSAQITVSTTDGSGLSQVIGVTVTKKPDPPKPAPTPQTGGDGVPRVGDVITLNPGERYYYDSWGSRPAGNLYSGVTNGVVIDGYSGVEYGGQSRQHGGFAIHIKSADGRYGNLGWVSLNQISGYASGTGNKGVLSEQIAEVNERGREMYITNDGRILRHMQPGDHVMTNPMTENILKWGKINPQQHLANSLNVPSKIRVPDRENNINITTHYDSLLTVNGNVDKETLPELKVLLEKSYKYTESKLYSEGKKAGLRKRL